MKHKARSSDGEADLVLYADNRNSSQRICQDHNLVQKPFNLPQKMHVEGQLPIIVYLTLD